MRKTYEFLRGIINKVKLDEAEKRDEDRSLGKRCMGASLWASYHYEFLLTAVSKKTRLPNDVLREALGGLKFADIAYTTAKQGYLLRYPENARHKHYTEEHPCDHVAHGHVEEIAADALQEFEDWAPYRERANKSPFPQ
jgi:hypothetical protein